MRISHASEPESLGGVIYFFSFSFFLLGSYCYSCYGFQLLYMSVSQSVSLFVCLFHYYSFALFIPFPFVFLFQNKTKERQRTEREREREENLPSLA